MYTATRILQTTRCQRNKLSFSERIEFAQLPWSGNFHFNLPAKRFLRGLISDILQFTFQAMSHKSSVFMSQWLICQALGMCTKLMSDAWDFTSRQALGKSPGPH
jgi:hypothetical protein